MLTLSFILAFALDVQTSRLHRHKRRGASLRARLVTERVRYWGEMYTVEGLPRRTVHRGVRWADLN